MGEILSGQEYLKALTPGLLSSFTVEDLEQELRRRKEPEAGPEESSGGGPFGKRGVWIGNMFTGKKSG